MIILLVILLLVILKRVSLTGPKKSVNWKHWVWGAPQTLRSVGRSAAHFLRFQVASCNETR